jgi:hypothetical protein
MDFLSTKDLVEGEIYVRISTNIKQRHPVYIVKVFPGQDTKTILDNFPYTVDICCNAPVAKSREIYVIYACLDYHGLLFKLVQMHPSDHTGFMLLKASDIPLLEKFADMSLQVDKISKKIERVLEVGFPTIKDEIINLLPAGVKRNEFEHSLQASPRLLKMLDKLNDFI